MRLSVVENNFPGKEDVSAKSLVYESLAFTTQECLLKELENRFPSTHNLCSLKKEEIPEGRCMDFGSCRKSVQGLSSCLCLVPAGEAGTTLLLHPPKGLEMKQKLPEPQQLAAVIRSSYP